ncbi:MAG: tripartite tricarboxylate transporter substrate binding protein [Proteobacteria bacterium]|nr:MAG: tripartite tricarboxylate transporter substrate binding protein [Pseudomonadota bacterium]
MDKKDAIRAGLIRRDILALAMGMAGLSVAKAEDAPRFPERSLVYINLFPPGGTTDLLSRIYCSTMGEMLGQQVVVENRSGAGGTVGQAGIAQAEPDGYTVGLGSVASLSIAPSTYPALPYVPAKDFTYISGIWKVPNVLLTNLDLPAKTIPELIALLKKSPKRYSYASSGFGTSPHISMEMFKKMAGVEVLHVPYRGGAPATIDLLAGRVQMMFDNAPTGLAAARDGKVRALAVTGSDRVEVAPDVPTMRDYLPDFLITSWGGLVGPAGMAPAVVKRLTDITHDVLRDAKLLKLFTENAATTWPTNSADFAKFQKEQEELFAGLIKQSGASID